MEELDKHELPEFTCSDKCNSTPIYSDVDDIPIVFYLPTKPIINNIDYTLFSADPYNVESLVNNLIDLKLRGEIVDYEIGEDGIKVIKKFDIHDVDLCTKNIPPQLCDKTDESCKYNCEGLCKKSC